MHVCVYTYIYILHLKKGKVQRTGCTMLHKALRADLLFIICSQIFGILYLIYVFPIKKIKLFLKVIVGK